VVVVGTVDHVADGRKGFELLMLLLLCSAMSSKMSSVLDDRIVSPRMGNPGGEGEGLPPTLTGKLGVGVASSKFGVVVGSIV